MHTNYNEITKTLNKKENSIVVNTVPIYTNNRSCDLMSAFQLPNGVMVLSQNGNVFIPNIKIVNTPDGKTYFDKM